MNQELSTTANLPRLVIAPVISGAVICVMAAAGLNTEATPNDLPTEENESNPPSRHDQAG
jgi:hypothetical protein